MNGKFFILGLSAFFLAGLLFSSVSWAENGILNQELSTKTEKLKSIEKSIAKKRSRKRRIEKNQQDVLSEIQALDHRIASQWESLQQAKKDWTAAELELEKTTDALNDTVRKIEFLKHYTELRFNAFRQMGELGLLNVFFAAQSLPDLLSRQEFLKMILDEDREKRKQYLKAIEGLSEKQSELKKRQDLLKVMSERMEKETLLLEERKREKKEFLDKLKKKAGDIRQ